MNGITVTLSMDQVVPVSALLKQGLERAMRMEAEEILLHAKLLTPVDRGWLQASGKVQGPVRYGAYTWETWVTFGDAATPYAIYVHEDLKKHHASPTQAKFLETPVQAASQNFAARIVARAGVFGR